MRTPFLSIFRESPFVKLLNHAKTIEAGGSMFRRAMICYLDGNCDEFDHLHMEVTRAESEADGIKRNIRGHLPKGLLMPVDKFQYLWYLREQDKIMDSMQDTLHWLSYRTSAVPAPLADDLLLMVDKAVEVVNEMPTMVNRAMEYFRSFSEEDRRMVKESIKALRNAESQSDQIERKLKSDIFSLSMAAPPATFHLIRLVEYIGDISNHAENSGDIMRAMIAR